MITRNFFDERGLQIESRRTDLGSITLKQRSRYDDNGRPSLLLEGTKNVVYTNRVYDEYGRISQIDSLNEFPKGPSTIVKTRTEYTYAKTSFSFSTLPLNAFPWIDPYLRTLPSSWIGSNNLIILEEIIEEPVYDSGTLDFPSDSGTLLSRKISEFDERGRLVAVYTSQFDVGGTTAVLQPTVFYYDEDNNLTRVQGPRVDADDSILYEYDGINRLTKIKTPSDNVSIPHIETFTYDNAHRVTGYQRDDKEPNNSVTTRNWSNGYDARGRRISFTEPGSNVTQFTYDDRNLLTSITTPNSIETDFEYGMMGEQLTQTFDESNLDIVNSWGYDSGRRIISYTDPMSQVTKYFYDSIGRLVKTEIPGGASFAKTFDSDGRLLQALAASGSHIDYTYDAFGGLYTLQGTGASGISDVPVHTFTYDGLGRVKTANITSGPSTTRAYDSLGSLISETNHSYAMQIQGYDPTTGIFQRVWSDGRIEDITSDLNGIINSISRNTTGSLGNDTNKILQGLKTSGPAMLGEALVYGTGDQTITPNRKIKIGASYDSRMRLTALVHTIIPPFGASHTLEKVDYTLDTVSRRTAEVITNSSSALQKSFAHTYDNKNRLTSSVESGVTKGYALNDADERTQYTETSLSARNYTYDPGHRLTAAGSDSADTYTDGPLNDIGSQNYSIDALGRTIEIDGTYIITFDALGRPAIIDDGTTARKLCYFGEELWQEVIGSTVNRQYSHHPLLFGPAGVHISGATYFPITDPRLNRLAISDSTGNVTERYRYTPFGETSSTSSVGLEPWFGGMRYLSSKGLYLGRQRVMHPKHGMWMGLDPLGYIDSPNLYGYAGQNPIDFVDPMGLSTKNGPAESSLTFPQRNMEFKLGKLPVAYLKQKRRNNKTESGQLNVAQSTGSITLKSFQSTFIENPNIFPAQDAYKGLNFNLPGHVSSGGYDVYYDPKGNEISRTPTKFKYNNSASDSDNNNYFIEAAPNTSSNYLVPHGDKQYWRLEEQIGKGFQGRIKGVVQNGDELIRRYAKKYPAPQIPFPQNLPAVGLLSRERQYYDFKYRNASRGANDYFDPNHFYVINGIARLNDYAGNATWGLIMSSTLPTTFMHMGAGFYQVISTTGSNWDWWKSLGDDPRDFEAIDYGVQLR